MSRAALIKMTGKTPFEIYLSHDGYPSFILNVLAKISGGYKALSNETISDAYTSEYNHTDATLKHHISTSPRLDYAWEYQISSAGHISIFCYEPWNQQDRTKPINPLHSLSTISDECKIEVAESIISAIKSLVGLGYTIEKTFNMSKLITIDDITFLTNTCLEDCEKLQKADFEQAGIAYDDSDGFYPLTKKEMGYVAEDGCVIGGSFWGTLGNTCIFNGNKYICSEIQLYFDNTDSNEVNKEKATLDNYQLLPQLLTIAEKIGGQAIWNEEVAFEYPINEEQSRSAVGEYTSYLLIPFDFAFTVASDQKHLKAFLTMADFNDSDFKGKTLKRIQTLESLGKLDEFIFLHDCDYQLTQVGAEYIDFDRTVSVGKDSIATLRITYNIKEATYFGAATLIDVNEKEHDLLPGNPTGETDQVRILTHHLQNSLHNLYSTRRHF